jgi:hypothetical protein
MNSQRRRIYALAGAMSVETADLLREVHRAAGPPGEVADVPPRRRAMLSAAAMTYGAAAACSALNARLLLAERADASERLGDLPHPHLAEHGVTSLEAGELQAWRGTVRAAAATLSELLAAKSAWERTIDALGEPVVVVLESLIGYVDDVASLLEASEPAEPAP